ncbi:MAG: hypothetical protein Kow0069_37740 [Promethearchaeota archaeon]
MKWLLLAVPAFNLEHCLEASVAKLRGELASCEKEIGLGTHLVIVDDNSSDGTSKLCRKLGNLNGTSCWTFSSGPSRRENLALATFATMVNKEGDGRGRFDYVGFVDADLSIDVSQVRYAVKLLQRFDLVVGNRFWGPTPGRSPARRLASFAYNLFWRFAFRSGVYDHGVGFKFFRERAFTKLVEEMGYDPSFRRGWLWDVQALLIAQRAGFSVAQIDVFWKPERRSSVRLVGDARLFGYAARELALGRLLRVPRMSRARHFRLPDSVLSSLNSSET